MKRRTIEACLSAGIALLALTSCFAQAERRLTGSEQQELVKRVAHLVGERYVFEEPGRRIQEALLQRVDTGDYQSPLSRKDFAKALTKDLQFVNGDRHLMVWPVPDSQNEQTPFDFGPTHGAPANFGLTTAETIDGNVGYLKFSNFSMDEMYRDACIAIDRAMGKLDTIDACIVDLRGNPGGGARLGTYLASYFFGETPVLLNTYKFRQRDDMECWTLSELPVRRHPQIPLCVLVDEDTFSASEGFAFQLKHHNRATIVGQPSGGGSHGGSTVLLNHGLEVFIPFSRSVHPKTDVDFEGVGVQPDIRVPSSQALTAAHRHLINRLRQVGSPDKLAGYELPLAKPNLQSKEELEIDTAASNEDEIAITFDTKTLPARMEKAANALLREQHWPGLAVVVVHKGETVFKKGFGYANLESKKPVDADRTIFRIGSISKALTLLTLTRQIDRGRISHATPVDNWHIAFAEKAQVEQPLTIDHLLTHTTGLDQIGVDRQEQGLHRPLAERIARRGSLADFLTPNNLRRVNEPGVTLRYDTYGTTLAGHILEKLTESEYAVAMQAELFDVLGMNSTSVETRTADRGRLAVGYQYSDGQFGARPYEVYRTTPASSIDSTAGDMARLLEALTTDGSNSVGRFLSKKMLTQVFSPHFRVHPKFCGVSHGLFESWTSDDGTVDVHLRSLGHGGSMDGYRAALTIIPSEQIGVFVATNRSPSDSSWPVDFRPLMDVVLSSLKGAPSKPTIAVPPPSKRDLGEYAGDFYYGMYCHSMTAADQGQGAWLREPATSVNPDAGGLRIGDELFLHKGNDLFVESNGQRMLTFSRDASGKVASFTYSTSPDTFERANSLYREYPSLAQRFYELAAEGDLKAAMEFFALQRDQKEFYLREAEFNNAGYALLRSDDTAAAIAAFRINTELYPESWNAHDSLGEALAEAGDIAAAIASYTRSVDLNPNNHAGKQRLMELRHLNSTNEAPDDQAER